MFSALLADFVLPFIIYSQFTDRVATQLAGYLGKKDKNGVEVRSWAEQFMPSIA